MRTYAWILGFAALSGFVAGCNGQQAGTPYADAEQGVAADEEGQDHHHEGPHGGHVVELAEDHSIHGEFVVDSAANVARFYVLGADLKSTIEATEVVFHAETADGGEAEVKMTPAGGGEKGSEFTAPLDGLPSKDIEQLHGHFHVTVEGKELAGDLTHDHDHDHDHAHEEPAKPTE